MTTTTRRNAADTPRQAPSGARGFLRRLTLATGGGMFLDGFVFASVAAALAGGAMSRTMGITPLWESLISSATLIGTFFGGLFLGYVTDRVGRRPMFLIDLTAFLVCSVLMFFVTAPWQLFVLSLLIGLAVGTDYAIGPPLLTEFAPRTTRGGYVGLLEILWSVGYVVAYLIGFLINSHWPGAWHITLAASTVPAAICLLLRHGLPESPRWLMSKGRHDEARAIIEKELGPLDGADDFADEACEETRYRTLFTAGNLGRTVFACVFWICVVMPYFALTFFQPAVLRDIGLGDSALAGALLGTIIAVVGAGVGWLLVDRVGRRPLTIGPMLGCAVTLFLVALGHLLPTWLATVCFFGYLFSYGIMSTLVGLYPAELFPTSVRTSGVGLAAAASRVGAAIGTFLLPLSLTYLGLQWSMAFMGAVSLFGALTSLKWAPETSGRSLVETGNGRPRTDAR